MPGLRPILSGLAFAWTLSTLSNAQDSEPLPSEKLPVIHAESFGVAHPVISSTYDVRPQIQLQPSTPRHRIVPAPKLPPAEKTKNYAGFQGTPQTPWSPPDPSIAVGPNHVVETVNMNLAFYQKDGTLLFSQRLDDSGSPGFFEDVGGGSFTFDPKCFYDTHSDRFFVLALEVYSSTAFITFAVSDDSDPNGTWFKYRTNAVTTVGGQTYWVDYPGIGFDEDAFYITGNLFGLSAGGFAGVKYRVFDKAPLLNGQSATFSDLRDGSGASAQVAHQLQAGEGMYFVSAGGSGLRFQTIQNPLSSPTLHTTNLFAGPFSAPRSSPTLGGGNIDTLDGRIMNVFADQGKVYTTHGIGIPGNSDSRCRWYEIDPLNWPSSGDASITQQGDLKFNDGGHAFFPAVCINANGEVGMIFGRGHANEFPSIWYAHRLADDQPGILQQPIELKAGEAGYNGGRWGDYFDLTLDPADNTTFWGIGEYSTDVNSWSTWIGTLDFNGIDYCAAPCDDPINYGTGTAGTGGIVPSVSAHSCPTIANPGFVISGDDFLPGALGVFFLGIGRANINGGGWTLLVNPNGPSIPVTYPGGSTAFTLPIPNNPFLAFLKVNVQFTAADPGAVGGISASDGLEFTICPKN